MTDNVPLQTKVERKEIFKIIGEIKSTAEDLAKLSRPMFSVEDFTFERVEAE